MKLKAAVTFFHKTIIQDAYNLTSYVRGRLMPYDDNARDSLMTDRRVIGVASEVVMPARNTIKIEGQAYLVGQETRDYNGTDTLHRKFILHRTDYVAQVRTFHEALTNTGTRDIWGSRIWVKESKETEESSDSFGAYQIYFARGEDLTDSRSNLIDGQKYAVMVKIENRWHMVRDVVTSAGGFQVAMADELPEPVLSTVVLKSNTYNPLTDADTTATTSIPCIFLRWQSSFRHLHKYSEQFKPGDYVMMVLKTDATPKVNDVFTIAARDFRVMSAMDETNVWSCHIRLV